MSDEIENLRIHFYGVQGSGSVFPSRAEREETRRHSDVHLLEQVFKHLQSQTDDSGRLTRPLTDYLGGEIDHRTLNQFRGQFDIEDTMRPAVFIPESKRLNMLLREFRANRNHMAIVVDEYEGVAGLVTIEDVLEQIVPCYL